jgi:RNase adaptor protein for sRNA GlmZ degradation
MSKIIKLIHDKFENDFGFIDGTNENNIDDIEFEIEKLSYSHYPKNIYSWGVKKDMKVDDCDIIFDVTLFFTKIEDHKKLTNMTGKDKEIQDSIMLHPRFLELIDIIITEIDREEPNSVAFICNHGKHRSVGWAEIIKKIYYPKSKLFHLDLKKIEKKKNLNRKKK